MNLFGIGFGIVAIIMAIGFIVCIGMFITVAAKSMNLWNKNSNSPRLTVDAKVVTKRSNASYLNAHSDGMHSAAIRCYVTFEVESGDRMEFRISEREYGLLAEGDKGRLSFQGTRYLNFERE